MNTNFLSLYLYLVISFVIHRTFIFDILSGSHADELFTRLQFYSVGVMSDIWMSFILSLLLWPIIRKNSRKINLIAVFLIGSLLSLHYSYVQYFHHQIIPFHFLYFGDIQFISANIATAFNPISLIHFLLVSAVGFFILHTNIGNNRFNVRYFAALFVVALIAHVANIRYKVQWFVPQKLQVNALEQLYFSITKRSNPFPLSRTEIKILAEKLDRPLDFNKNQESAMLNRLLLQDSLTNKSTEAFKLLKVAYDKIKSKQIMLILMESQRPSESSLYQNNDKSLTPVLDNLGRKGFFFTNAFTTGVVTRTGQEAALCGTRSGQETSFMRGRSDVVFACLPLQSKRLNLPIEFNWLHGGEPKFDSQMQFWKDQATHRLISAKDMPVNNFATGWGASDLTLFEYAAVFFANQKKAEVTQISTILTVTNHIPWTLPEDIEIKTAEIRPSYRTTNYADSALGVFVEKLKKSDVWQNSILIIASDHGNLEPPFFPLYEHKNHRQKYSLSHMNLVLTGGIVESLRQEHPQLRASQEHYVSQADIASTIAQLNDIPFKTMGDNLFNDMRLTPVYTDMGNGIFIPAEDLFVSRDRLLSKKPMADVAPLYHKAYLRLINFWK